MTNDELDAIVGIAKSWHLGELSLVQLLAQSRYHALRPQLSLALLQRYLKEHPEHLKHWEFYSEDKRTDGGSYLFRFGPPLGSRRDKAAPRRILPHAFSTQIFPLAFSSVR